MRINLTLDRETYLTLEKHAQKEQLKRATLARELLREALQAREREERRRLWSEAYRTGREDDLTLVNEVEDAQLDLVGDENG